MTPCLLLRKWLQLAIDRNIPKADAFGISTVSAFGIPSSRMVLVSQINDDGLFFFTDSRSRKIEDIKSNCNACGLFYWPTLRRQVRIEGVVEAISESFAERDFYSKTVGQQLMIVLTKQSEQIKHYRILRRTFFESVEGLATEKYVAKPDYWCGYVLKIKKIEFFKSDDDRINKRVLFSKLANMKWKAEHLAP